MKRFKKERLREIRNRVKTATYPDDLGLVSFVLVYKINDYSFIYLKSESSAVKLHVEKKYPLIIGEATNRAEFCLAIYNYYFERNL